ncbi:MAG: tRNA 4-thiouridine(8) synthase ThiI [Syntrophomonadaceae bacterium]|nr:tRNA 4-thiouridine(8) synthase ThiI [Syntrophomonadaceae bacterium]
MKAISLFSGGLDSQLAVCLVKKQGITVEAINFKSPFFGDDIRTYQAAENLNVKLHLIDTGEEYISKVLKDPIYGYGKNLNPCIDCHGFMLRKAGEMLEELGASFIITGEVVGQRPMSQNKSALNAVDKISGYKGYILRPLSAKLLTPTIPELEGWIDREKLEDISGRNRQRQFELANKFNIIEYPAPAGGCLLTEANFSNRLKKMWSVSPNSNTQEMGILKVGRHFYLEDNLLVVGRNASENEKITEDALAADLLIKVSNRPGPIGLIRKYNSINEEIIQKAAAIIARYSDAKSDPIAKVKVYDKDNGLVRELEVKPMLPEQVPTSI